MRKLLPILLILVYSGSFAQSTDTLKPREKKVHALVGVDAFSALNTVSLVGGVQINRGKYTITLSHLYGSSRLGVYYDFCVHRKYKFYVGVGYHNSFRFNAFGPDKNEYRDSLIKINQEAKTSTISFLPDYGETRLQYFYSFSVSKELKIYKALYFNFKVMLVYGYNPYYQHGDVFLNEGVQLYCKW